MRTWGALDPIPEPDPPEIPPAPIGYGAGAYRRRSLEDPYAPPPAEVLAERKAAERGPALGLGAAALAIFRLVSR